MTTKFQRFFVMEVDGQTDFHTFGSPLTCKFNVEQTIYSSASVGKFTFYNLGVQTRRDLYFNIYDNAPYLGATFKAGYGSQFAATKKVPTIFRGNITGAWTKREGPNWVTQVDAFDGGFGIFNSQVSLTKPPINGAAVKFKDVALAALATMKRTKVGFVSDLDISFPRGETLVGNTWDEVRARLSPDQGQLFIDGEVANILGTHEYFDTGTIPLIAAPSKAATGETYSSGLLNTPRKQGALVMLDMLFEPSLRIGQAVDLKCLEQWMNGRYKIVGVNHYGTISETMGGDAITSLSLFAGYPGKKLTPVTQPVAVVA